MIDLTKYNLTKEDSDVIKEIYRAFEIGLEMSFVHSEKDYHINYEKDKIWVYENKEETPDYFYDSPDDFFLYFLLEDKPFIERFNELTSFDFC